MRAVFLDSQTVDNNDIQFDALHNAVDALQLRPTTAARELLPALQNQQIAISNKIVLDGQTLQQCPELRLICVAATGTNNIDLVTAKALGITVCNVTRYATPSVTQLVFSFMLNFFTRTPDYQHAVHAGRWSQSPFFCLLDFPITELHGKTLGIIGYGELGRSVANIATAFGMKVLIAQGSHPAPDRVPLPQLLQQADVVSLHCPLTEQTRHLIGAKQLTMMKPGALLINTARGGIVDEAALIQALQQGSIGGACVDVLSQEPPSADHPMLRHDIPNLVVTPHIAWASREARQRLCDQIAANITAFRTGSPINVM
ncbi:MAG: 2-hydroxyacid dehydrogenase [Gammaproteobacteria bacterium]|nr:2-hydroxyacid dehydrogenase [Gammaproteobacteria bacterium]